jgi:hypothetical protein
MAMIVPAPRRSASPSPRGQRPRRRRRARHARARLQVRSPARSPVRSRVRLRNRDRVPFFQSRFQSRIPQGRSAGRSPSRAMSHACGARPPRSSRRHCHRLSICVRRRHMGRADRPVPRCGSHGPRKRLSEFRGISAIAAPGWHAESSERPVRRCTMAGSECPHGEARRDRAAESGRSGRAFHHYLVVRRALQTDLFRELVAVEVQHEQTQSR